MLQCSVSSTRSSSDGNSSDSHHLPTHRHSVSQILCLKCRLLITLLLLRATQIINFFLPLDDFQETHTGKTPPKAPTP